MQTLREEIMKYNDIVYGYVLLTCVLVLVVITTISISIKLIQFMWEIV